MKDISIVIAAHSEGVIAHKTLLSIKQALIPLKKSGISYEVIVTLDNPTTETTDYFARQDVLDVNVAPISFGELAASRNFGISKAKGTYIAIVDADDLVSENWLLKGLELARQERAIIHTEYSVNFGQASIVWHKKNSLDRAHESLRNVDANQWDSAIIAPKELLSEFPFVPNASGFAPEDWHFNCQTLAAGVPHKVAQGTVLYVRRKEVSVMSEQASQKRIPHFTNLLDLLEVQKIPESTIESIKGQLLAPAPVAGKSFKQVAVASAKVAYRHAQSVPGVGRVARKLRNKATVSMVAPSIDLPKWLIEDWRSMHSIEKDLFPSQETLANTVLYNSDMYELGIFYWQMAKHITSLPTYIIFVPYLIRGGADLVAINYANYLAELDPKQKVLVVATENIPSKWSDKLLPNVDFLPFGELAGGLPYDLQVQMLSRLVIQTKALTLHNIHSPKAFTLFNQYRQLFTSNPFELIASAFCDDVDNEGRISGHIHSGLPKVHDMLDVVMTDNEHVIDQLVHEYGYRRDLFVTHYQPTYPSNNTYSYSNKPFKIVWAGRICKQKRPDILLAVAKQLSHRKDITIDVYGVMEEGFDASYFASAPNITYKGAFSNGLGPLLDEHNYQLLLYTSERDGMPNIVLEAASRGLPMVAPKVGGIGEVVTGKFLVDPLDDIAQYYKQILRVADKKDILQSESQRLSKLIDDRHSKASNIAFLKKELLPRIQSPTEL